MSDFVTILTHQNLAMAKRWKADGTIEPYSLAKHFKTQEAAVASFHDLSKLLFKLEKSSTSCIIRGKYKGDAYAKQHLNGEYKPGLAVRQKDLHEEEAHNWLLVEVDNFVPMTADPVRNPVAACEEFITTELPPEFHGVSYHWQLSNSAGHEKNRDKLKAHLWFWSEAPHTSDRLRAWADALVPGIDKSVFDSIQVHYTAAAVFDEGVVDPVPMRSGRADRARDSVALTIPDTLPSRKAPASQRAVLEECHSNDPVAQLLFGKGMVKSIGKKGELFIECPREEHHTGESGDTATAYYPANTGGFAEGNFKCLHDHCATVGKHAFLDALGYVEDVSDDFEDCSEHTGAKRKKYRFKACDEFLTRERCGYIIDDVLPKAALGVIYGASAAGKTFFALDLVMAVARGVDWRGHEVEQGTVAYICAEGAGGFRDRLAAYAQAADDHGILNPTKIPIHVLDAAPNFLHAPDIDALIAATVTLSPVKVIIVDTLAQVMPGGDENSGKDVGNALAHCRALHKATGALVILIHHSGKDESRGARGWSGLRAAVDVEIEVCRKNDDRFAKITKMKDGEDGATFGFKLLPVSLGEDARGKDIVSCVVRPAGVNQASMKRPVRPMTQYETGLWNAINALCVSKTEVGTAAALDRAVDDGPVSCKFGVNPNSKDDRRRDEYRKAIKKLVKRGLISHNDEVITVMQKADE